jgi:DNA ligase-1
MKYDTLYHIDENLNLRIWYMEQEDDVYRTVSGIENGQLVTSEWKKATGKNKGKKNETSDSEQAKAEVLALYEKKLARKYHRNKEDVEQGSKIIEPMLASSFKGWNDNWTEVFSQPKLDGMRCIATANGLFSRQGKPIVSCPHIEEALKPIFNIRPDLILDGELYNHNLKDNFNELLSVARQTKPTPKDLAKSKEMIEYHIYDNLDEGIGFDTRSASIHGYYPEVLTDPCIKFVHTIGIYNSTELDAEYASLLQDGYEGQIIRISGSLYENKRSKGLIKRKEFIDEEFEVLEILEGQGNWAGYAKSVSCKSKAGVVFSAGIKGNQQFARELFNRTSPPKTATIRYQNVTPDGSYRFPIAVAFYEGDRDV